MLSTFVGVGHGAIPLPVRTDLGACIRRVLCPERSPSLDSNVYNALVATRATRQYFVGTVSLLETPSGFLYGFDVFANFSDSEKALLVDEIRELYERLGAVFRLAPLVYAPSTRAVVDTASAWDAPGLPILLGGRPPATSFEAYTVGVGYGRVRILRPEELADLNDSGQISFQDIFVLLEDPRDIEGVLSAAY